MCLPRRERPQYKRVQLHQAGVPDQVIVLLHAHDNIVADKHMVLGNELVEGVNVTLVVSLVVDLDVAEVRDIGLVNVELVERVVGVLDHDCCELDLF